MPLPELMSLLNRVLGVGRDLLVGEVVSSARAALINYALANIQKAGLRLVETLAVSTGLAFLPYVPTTVDLGLKVSSISLSWV